MKSFNLETVEGKMLNYYVQAQTAEARYKVQEAQLKLFLKRNNTTLKELDLE